MPETEERTSYFSFGFNHAHAMGGGQSFKTVTYDKDVLVKITAPDPRAVMFQTFGREWSMEYREADLAEVLHWFPRGVREFS